MKTIKYGFDKVLEEIVQKKLEEIEKVTKENIKQKLRDCYKQPLFKTDHFDNWSYWYGYHYIFGSF